MIDNLQLFTKSWLPALEAEMRTVLSSAEPAVDAHYGMMQYHMGWVDADFRPDVLPSGKRLRPLLCLLACAEVGGNPEQALPAAAAIEILHNFSLVYDDIEDGDAVRRHRPTVWKLWGVPLAINAGDGMFTLAFAAMQRLSGCGVPAATVLDALATFTTTCVALTEGQFLDMHFEQRSRVTVDEYLRMIQGKTAALVGASVAIGATVGGAPSQQQAALQRFGQAIGLAFQIQDDILGIWGDPRVTGKAAGNDILRKKKSLPMLHVLNDPTAGGEFAALLEDEVTAEQLPQALALLEQAGTRAFAAAEMRRWHDRGVAALGEALGAQAEASALAALAAGLLDRRT
jgi:geranylgeranyl diphosphate synthase type I